MYAGYRFGLLALGIHNIFAAFSLVLAIKISCAARDVNVGGCGGVVHPPPPRQMIQSVSNEVQSVSKLCVCLYAVLCEANQIFSKLGNVSDSNY